MLLKHFQKFWKWLVYLGVSKNFLEENTGTKILNQLAFTSSAGLLVVSFLLSFSSVDPFYLLLLVLISLLYALVLLMNGLHKIHLARIYLSAVVPFWAAAATLLIGGNFNHSIVTCTFLLFIYWLYQKQPWLRFALIVLNALLYLIPSIYVNQYGPIYQPIDIPLDEYVNFIVALAWMWILFMAYNRNRERLITRLKDKNIELENTTEELERFSYIASHDLKSPLRTVVSFLGLIERDIKRGKYEEVQSNLEFAKTGAQQMNYLVNDILELSRINAPNRIRKEKVPLDRVLKKVYLNLQERIDNQNVSIIAEPLPSYFCNEVEFLLLFQNIIENGIKYNDQERPSLKIWSENGNGTLQVFFQDNGIGIDPAYHQQIFQFFKRLHTTDENAGTGMGLGLCKKILQKYDGDIRVESVPEQGSTFSIHLPVRKH